MSPTATIVTVIAALIFFAWLFQSPTYDPGYEAWKKRQQEEKSRVDDSRRVVAAGNVVDPDTTDHRSLEEIRLEGQRQKAAAADAGISAQASVGAPIINPETADPYVDPFKTTTPITIPAPPSGTPIDPQVIQKVDQQVRQMTFGSHHVLDGTFVGVAYTDDGAQESLKGEEPRITFHRDGTFTTRNMGAADVDMESATALGARVDRGTGRYKISRNILDLTYTDGLERSKGNQRTYVIMPVGGAEDAPLGITIQGKLFKLESAR